MSVSGISSSSFFAGLNSTSVQSKFKQVQQDFQQLGQDLQSGYLTKAQSDFSALQKLLPSQQSVTVPAQTGSQASNPISQAISQLAQDLQSGNLSAAQSDFATLQKDVQQRAVAGHHHHHLHAGDSQASAQQTGPATLFGDLGREPQSGNLTAAQQTYNAFAAGFLAIRRRQRRVCCWCLRQFHVRR